MTDQPDRPRSRPPKAKPKRDNVLECKRCGTAEPMQPDRCRGSLACPSCGKDRIVRCGAKRRRPVEGEPPYCRQSVGPAGGRCRRCFRSSATIGPAHPRWGKTRGGDGPSNAPPGTYSRLSVALGLPPDLASKVETAHDAGAVRLDQATAIVHAIVAERAMQYERSGGKPDQEERLLDGAERLADLEIKRRAAMAITGEELKMILAQVVHVIEVAHSDAVSSGTLTPDGERAIMAKVAMGLTTIAESIAGTSAER